MVNDSTGVGDRVTVELRGLDGKLRQPVDETPDEVRRAAEHAETRTEDDRQGEPSHECKEKIGEIIGRVTWELFGPDGELVRPGSHRTPDPSSKQNLAERGTGFAPPQPPPACASAPGRRRSRRPVRARRWSKLTNGIQAFDGTYPQSALSGSGNNARRSPSRPRMRRVRRRRLPRSRGRDRQRHDRLRHRDGGGGHVRPRPARRHRVKGAADSLRSPGHGTWASVDLVPGHPAVVLARPLITAIPRASPRTLCIGCDTGLGGSG